MTLPVPFAWPPPIPVPPTPTPPAPTTDDVINTSSVPGASASDALDSLLATANAMQQLRVYLTVAHNTANNTWAKILFDTVVWDTAGAWNAAGHHYVIPATGYYYIAMRARTNTPGATTSATMTCAFAFNAFLPWAIGGDSPSFACGGSTIAHFNAGDLIDAWLYTTTVRTLTVAPAGYDTWFEICGPLKPF